MCSPVLFSSHSSHFQLQKGEMPGSAQPKGSSRESLYTKLNRQERRRLMQWNISIRAEPVQYSIALHSPKQTHTRVHTQDSVNWCDRPDWLWKCGWQKYMRNTCSQARLWRWPSTWSWTPNCSRLLLHSARLCSSHCECVQLWYMMWSGAPLEDGTMAQRTQWTE